MADSNFLGQINNISHARHKYQNAGQRGSLARERIKTRLVLRFAQPLYSARPHDVLRIAASLPLAELVLLLGSFPFEFLLRLRSQGANIASFLFHLLVMINVGIEQPSVAPEGRVFPVKSDRPYHQLIISEKTIHWKPFGPYKDGGD